MTDPASVLLILAAVLLLFAGGRLLHNWFKERKASEELPLLLFDLSTSSLRVQESTTTTSAPDEMSATPKRDGARPAGHVAAGEADNHSALANWSPQTSGRVSQGPPTTADGSHEYEATLQLLPGRLEPIQGQVGREIRFVRGPGAARYTMGRSVGPAHTHIQLDSPTASRMHAVMEYTSGRWRIGNLSRTNQVVVNGVALEGDVARVLEEGDHVELGALVFVFRSR